MFKKSVFILLLISCLGSSCNPGASGGATGEHISKKKTFTSTELCDALRNAKGLEEFDELERRVKAGECSKCDGGPDYWIDLWIKPKKKEFLEKMRTDAKKLVEDPISAVTSLQELENLDPHKIEEMGLVREFQEKKLNLIDKQLWGNKAWDDRCMDVKTLKHLQAMLNDPKQWSKLDPDKINPLKKLSENRIGIAQDKISMAFNNRIHQAKTPLEFQTIRHEITEHPDLTPAQKEENIRSLKSSWTYAFPMLNGIPCSTTCPIEADTCATEKNINIFKKFLENFKGFGEIPNRCPQDLIDFSKWKKCFNCSDIEKLYQEMLNDQI